MSENDFGRNVLRNHYFFLARTSLYSLVDIESIVLYSCLVFAGNHHEDMYL